MLPLILIIVLALAATTLGVLLWLCWSELKEVNVRFDQVVAESERLRRDNGILVSKKDRAFRRMRKAEQLLADYRAAGYTQFDFDALRNDYDEQAKILQDYRRSWSNAPATS